MDKKSKKDENYAYVILAKNLKKYRKEAGLTQDQLAEKKFVCFKFYKKSRI